ncbi:MAG: di-trans,poly-cis-decaprenylcistransferase [Myxococcales bacterium]|nr:MAG: di-trans,poly-cis-decaprenylcistransferase [Myxococcales bacterium]
MPTLDAAWMPRHIAIIMDGNGRWAQKRKLQRVRGHEKGAETVRRIVTACRELGVKALSLYAFSEENWSRPRLEVRALMGLLRRFLVGERATLLKNSIRLVVSGRLAKLPDSVREKLLPLIAETANNRGMTLNLCLAYGGKEEIVDACQAIAGKAASGQVAPEAVTPEFFEQHLYVPDLPPIDLMIRTSGEQRISGFLPWQLTYAELYFTPVFWPDFTRADLETAIADYQARERRFGKTSAQTAKLSRPRKDAR